MNKETIRMQRLAGVISESEYNFLLEEIKQDEGFITDLKKLEDLSLEYVTKYGKTKINHE
jgi:hypothetical protein